VAVGQRTRVLLLVENNTYPADFRVRREAAALRDAGYDTSVIAPRGPGQRSFERHDGVAVYRFAQPFSGRGVIGFALEFGYATTAMLSLAVWVAITRGVDVVHAANPPDTLCFIGAALKLFGKRFVFDHHDLAPEVYLSRFGQPREDWLYLSLRTLERWSYAAADVVIATNQSYRRLAIERGGKPADKVFVVRNGPPLAYQAGREGAVPRSGSGGRIGYVGTIGPQDGLDHLVRAIHIMVHELGRQGCEVIVIGDGDALDGVKRLAGALSVNQHFTFTGRLAEGDARLRLLETDVCVQPDPLSPLNDWSTMNKLMEYMALGKPVVAFDLLETRRSAADAALYAVPNDVADFARKLVWLLDHPGERARMGRAGQQRVAQSLAWEYSVPELLRAYREGLGLSPRMRRARRSGAAERPWARIWR
jgi:glycosyltransferase involved in cell wall biosynthesis